MLAVTSFGVLSSVLGLGIVPLDRETDMLAPLATSVVGTIFSHAMIKNKQLSVKQGWNINYMTGIGSVLGLGVAILSNPKSHNPYIILPAAGGMIAWFASLSSQTRKVIRQTGLLKKGNISTSFRLTPENYFLNRRFMLSDGMRPAMNLPLFEMNLIF